MLRGLCRAYVGLLRNVPILVQLIFWYELCGHLPGPRQAWSPLCGIYLTNRGLRLPSLTDAGGGDLAAAICGIVLLGASLGSSLK
jgi:general L-amino acid transport system permease protein